MVEFWQTLIAWSPIRSSSVAIREAMKRKRTSAADRLLHRRKLDRPVVDFDLQIVDFQLLAVHFSAQILIAFDQQRMEVCSMDSARRPMRTSFCERS